MEERRELERFRLCLPAEILVRTGDRGPDALNLVTSDICSGGAFFSTNHPLPEGTRVSLEVILPIDRLRQILGSQALIRLSGVVKRSESSGMAIRFNEDCEMTSINTPQETVADRRDADE